MISIESLRERDGSPYLGEAAYDAFWQFAYATGEASPPPGGHPAFSTLKESAQWGWHAAGMAAVTEAAG